MEGFTEEVEGHFNEFEDLLMSKLDKFDGDEQMKLHQKVLAENQTASQSVAYLEEELVCWQKVHKYLSQQINNNNNDDEGDQDIKGSSTQSSEESAAARQVLELLKQFLKQKNEEEAPKEVKAEEDKEDRFLKSRPRRGGTAGTSSVHKRRAGKKHYKGKKDNWAGPKKVLTRRLRTLKGGDLIDPFKYHDCLKCSKGFYKEAELRQHYNQKHGLEFGSAPLPSSELELQCTQTDEQQTTRCFICQHKCATVEELIVHKSYHVDERFTRHRCGSCGQRFVVLDELEAHQMVCSCDHNNNIEA